MNKKKEEWRDIPRYIGFYQASDFGRIKSKERAYFKKNGILTINKTKIRKLVPDNGYLKVQFWINNKHYSEWVHRLIAETFIPNPENKPQVNHKKGIKTDNRVSELEWMTYEEDREHAVRVLAHKWDKGIRHKGHSHIQSKKVKQIDPNSGSIIKIWDCVSDVIKSKIASNVSMCATGKLKTSGGFIWKYE